MIMEKTNMVGESSDGTIGSGRMTLEENEPSQMAFIDLEKLDRVVKMAKDLGWETVAVRVQNDYPLLLSNVGTDGENLIGFIISPILVEE